MTAERPPVDWAACLLCGHPLTGHNFAGGTMLTVPCPDCPNGRCRNDRPRR